MSVALSHMSGLVDGTKWSWGCALFEYPNCTLMLNIGQSCAQCRMRAVKSMFFRLNSQTRLRIHLRVFFKYFFGSLCRLLLHQIKMLTKKYYFAEISRVKFNETAVPIWYSCTHLSIQLVRKIAINLHLCSSSVSSNWRRTNIVTRNNWFRGTPAPPPPPTPLHQWYYAASDSVTINYSLCLGNPPSDVRSRYEAHPFILDYLDPLLYNGRIYATLFARAILWAVLFLQLVVIKELKQMVVLSDLINVQYLH